MTDVIEPPKIHVTWDEYLRLINELFVRIRASGFTPQQIVCIARGGLIPGDFASRVFGAPLAVLSVASYPDGETKQETAMFSRDLTTAKPLCRTNVLVMDDLTETGVTLKKTLEWLHWWYSIDPREMRTATLWHKTWSTFTPDFFAKVIDPDPITGARPWIVQPQEQFGLSFRH